MRYENNDILREYLHRGAVGAYREHLQHPRFEFDEFAFKREIGRVCRQFPFLEREAVHARAAFRLLVSGEAPQIAVPLPTPWFRCKRFVRETAVRGWPWLKITWAIAVLALLLVLAGLAHAEPLPQAYRNAVRGLRLLPEPQQPGGFTLQFFNGASQLATRAGGLVAFKCSTGMTCSWSGSTFTLTSTGGGGSGCIPPGSIANALLYDSGAGGCADSGLTWSGSTATAPNGITLTYSGTGIINARKWASTGITNTESLGKIPIGNGDGTATWSDPFVSGITAHDAVGTSTNPVLIGGYASAAAPTDVSADGDATRAWVLRNGSQVMNLASGGTLVTLGQKAMTASLPMVIASDQSAVPVSGPLTDTQLRATPVPVSGTVTVTDGAGALNTIIDSGTVTTVSTVTNLAQLGGAAISMNTGVRDAGTQRMTIATNDSVSVTGTFWQATQPVSGTVTVTDGAGALNTIIDSGSVTVTQGTGTNLHMVCDSGCSGSGGTSMTDNAAFTGGSSAVTPVGALYDTTPPTITDGSIGAPRMDSSRYLYTNCVVGCSGSAAAVQVRDASNVLTDVGYFTGNKNMPVQNSSEGSTGSAVPTIGTMVGGTDGTNLRAIATDSTGIVKTILTTGSAQIGHLEANQSVNIAQMNGVATTMGNGASGTGVQRVTIANDSTGIIALTTGSAQIGHLEANQSTNIAQMNGVAVTMGNGASGTGVQRVTLANDSTGIVALTTGSAQIGHLEANQSANVAQINGVTPLMGAGNTGTGSPRVTISTDQAALAGMGVAATGGAVPANASYSGGNGTGNLKGYLNCDNSAIYDTNTNGSTELVALTSNQVVYVCGFQFSQSTTTTVSVKLVYGTGTACATGETAMTPNYPIQAATSTGPIGLVVMTPGFTGLKTAASNALCIKTSAAVSVQALVWYTKFQ